MIRYLWTGALFILLLLLFCACQPIVDTAEAAPDECSIAGSWIGSYSGGPWDDPLIHQSTLVPVDPEGERFAYVMRWVNPDVTLRAEPFAEADYSSEMVGEAVKTGPGTYDISLIGYGVKERDGDRNQILYIFTADGTLTCVGADEFVNDVTLSIFMAEQDADRDGFPDEGEVPTCHGPTDFGSARRIPIAPGCVPAE